MFLFITALIFMFISKLRFPKKVSIIKGYCYSLHSYIITFCFLRNLILINGFFLLYYGYQLEVQKPTFFRLIWS